MEFERLAPDFGSGWGRTSSGLYIPHGTSPKALYGQKPLGIDLFCGIGGMSLGFMQAGFRVVAAVDNEPAALISYMHNLGTYPIQIHFVEDKDRERLEKELNLFMRREKNRAGVDIMPLSGHGLIASEPEILGVPHVWLGDIRKITGKEMLDTLGLKQGEIDVVMGGPPCQGFSMAGKREIADPRNNLVFEFARMVLEIQPRTMMMENVPGILSMKTPEGDSVIDKFCSVLADGGFGKYEALKKAMGVFPDAKVIRGRTMKVSQEAPAQAALF